MPMSRDNGSRITKWLLSSRYVIFIFCRHTLTTAKLTPLTYPSSFNGAEAQPPARLRVIRFILFYLRSRWAVLDSQFLWSAFYIAEW
jgi:hypothetical protein